MLDQYEVRPFPELIENQLKMWWFLATIWYILHFALGVIGIMSAAIVPFLKDHQVWQAVVTGVSVICTGLVTFLGARRNATLYVQAWRALKIARLKFVYDKTLTASELLEVIRQREEIIERSESDQQVDPYLIAKEAISMLNNASPSPKGSQRPSPPKAPPEPRVVPLHGP